MPTKFVIAESASFKISAADWPGAEVIPLAEIKEKLPFFSGQSLVVVGGTDTRYDPAFFSFLEKPSHAFHLLQFSGADDAVRFAKHFHFLQSETRATGIKCLLNPGSTIFTESFFNGFGLGAKIDTCHDLARDHLKPATAFSAWAALQSILVVGLRALPDNGDKGTGEKVDMQIGADGQRFVCSVQFPLPADRLAEFRRHPVLEILRTSAGFFELRYHKMGGRAEILAVFYSGEGPRQAVECQSYSPSTPLEDPAAVKEYTYRTLTSLRDAKSGPAAAPASAFKKKKLSQQMQELAPAAPAPTPAPTVVVSGSAKLGAAPTPASDNGSTEKIQALEAKVKEKDQTIARLSKEISEFKEPQREVINNIKDTQVQGLKDNIARLEAELAEALEREQEQESQSAVPAKVIEQYQKKIKDLEVKLKAATDERSSKIMGLEKQLEDQKRKTKELSKKVTELTEQLRDAA